MLSTAYLPAQQLDDAVQLVLAVVDAVQQRPLVLDRIAGQARVALALLHQLAPASKRGARGSRRARRSGLVVCSDSASAGLTRPRGRRSNTRGSPTVENTRFLCAIFAFDAQQLDGFQHVVEVVRRLAHAHEHDFLHGPPARAPAPPGRRSRRSSPGGSGRPAPSCRTGSRPRSRPGWTRRRRRAAAAPISTVWPSCQPDQQARRAVLGGMGAEDAGQAVELGVELAARLRARGFGRKSPGRRRPWSWPALRAPSRAGCGLVQRQGAEGAQAGADGVRSA